MEAYLLHIHHRSASFLPFPQRHRILLPLMIPTLPERNPSSAVVVTRSTNNTGAGAWAPVQAKPAPATSEIKKTVYNDNWFNCLAISYMSSSIQATLGMKIMNMKGYEGFVEAATLISRTYGAMEQQQIVMEALNKAFPEFILFMASSPNFLQFSLTIQSSFKGFKYRPV
ncbi:Beta-carotene isomerase D27, chloroplastic [Dendrobium catenatum]|uniref:Beta-carotene isomerase D27, chloroplastic n=1 Tax=Dendrobium catenatum TaxID=906689 RepID=A0A2I0XCB9_9ASPA|nr:Beta-carotene isomerase D27, chloroplastic [Dendrobium catenatum]